MQDKRLRNNADKDFMKIIVCIKQVPDTTDIKWTENNTIQREGVESVINPFDVYAINMALSIKEKLNDVEISVLTMGPNQAEDILRRAIAVGCDNGILISDKKFAGADTFATAKTLSAAIKTKLSDFDLIICGQFAVDGDTAQTGPELAAQLDIPQVTYVKDIIRFDEKFVYAERELEDGRETVKVNFPALICMLKADKEPVRPTINGFINSQKAEILKYGMDAIGLSQEEVGIKGSPTFVSKAFRPLKKRDNCQFFTDFKELAEKIQECGGNI